MSNDSDEIMDSNEHPQDEQIQDYVKAPHLPEFNPLRLHLASCRFCRRRAELTGLIQDHGHWLETDEVEVSDSVNALMTGKLESQERKNLQQSLKQDPASLRAALHYASHAHAMNSLRQPPLSNRSDFRAQIISTLRGWLSYQAPLWKTVPALAVLMVIATLLINQYGVSRDSRELSIISFNDNPVIQIVAQEAQPGIGFFAQPGSQSQSYGEMRIEMKGGHLQLSWPEVESAVSYTLKLQRFDKGETQLLSRQTVTGNSLEIALSEPLQSGRYEWVLTGEIDSQRSFHASGGFVVAMQ